MLARASGARVHRTDLALFVDLDSAYVFDNIAIPTGFLSDDQLSRVIADADTFFPAGRPWTLQALSPSANLVDHGLVLLGHPPLMYRPIGGSGPQTPMGLEIRPVATPDDLIAFGETGCGRQMAEMLRSVSRTVRQA